MKLAAALIVLFACSGCEKGMHDMYDQARDKPLSANKMFADGGASRPPVEGTEPHARGDFSDTSSGRIGKDDQIRWDRDVNAQSNPYPITMELLNRGRERFEIYCSPCHSVVGDGDGFIVHRGFPSPPSYHIERLRTAPDRHFFDVITHGYGIMYPYGDRVEPADRWAIVAYIRALQLSRNVPAAQLSSADKDKLRGAQ
jgi:mono/diheme cytochrome c family protein